MSSNHGNEKGAAAIVALVLAAVIAAGLLVWALALQGQRDAARRETEAARRDEQRLDEARELAVRRGDEQAEELRALRSERTDLLRRRERLERALDRAGIERDRERSLRLAELAISRLDDDPPLATRLAVGAFRAAETEPARSALLRALMRGREIAAVTGVRGLLVAPTGETLALRLASELLLVAAVDGAVRGRLDGLDESGTMAFSGDGRSLVATTSDHGLVVASAEDVAVRHRLEVDSRVTSLAFDADDRRLLVGTTDRAAWLFDLESGAKLRVLVGHDGRVDQALFVDEETVATFGADNVLRFFDAASGERLREIQGTGRPERTRLVAAPKAQRLVLVDSGNRGVDVIDTETGDVAFSAPLRDDEQAASTGGGFVVADDYEPVLAPDGLALLRVADDGRKILRLDLEGSGRWEDHIDLGEGRLVHLDRAGLVVRRGGTVEGLSLEPGRIPLTLADPADLVGFAMVADGSLLAWSKQAIRRASGADEGETLRPGGAAIVRCLRPRCGGATIVLTEDGRLSWQGDEPVFPPAILRAPRKSGKDARAALWLSPDRSLALAAQADGRARLLRVADGELLLEIGQEGLIAAHAAFAASAPLLAVGLVSPPELNEDATASKSRLRIYDLEAMTPVHDEEVAAIEIGDALRPDLDLSADGRLVFLRTTADAKIRTWQDRSLEHELWTFGSVTTRFAPRGALAAAGGSRLVVVDRFTGAEKELPGGIAAGADVVEFLPDGRRLVVGQDDAIRVLDLERGEVLQVFGGRDLLLDLLAVAPDGRSALAASRDRSEVRLLDLEGGLLAPAIALPDRCRLASWSPDGGRLALTFASRKGVFVLDAESGRAILDLPDRTALGAMFAASGRDLLLLDAEGALLRLPLDAEALVAERALSGLGAEERARFHLSPTDEDD